MRAWLLRWWHRFVDASLRPLETRLAQGSGLRAYRVEQMVMGLADMSANHEAAITGLIQSLREQHARNVALQSELLARLVDRVGVLLDAQEAESARSAQLDARLQHLAIQLTGKSAAEVMRELGARPARKFDFEHRQ